MISYSINSFISICFTRIVGYSPLSINFYNRKIGSLA